MNSTITADFDHGHYKTSYPEAVITAEAAYLHTGEIILRTWAVPHRIISDSRLDFAQAIELATELLNAAARALEFLADDE